jgi:hypothetical protein
LTKRQLVARFAIHLWTCGRIANSHRGRVHCTRNLGQLVVVDLLRLITDLVVILMNTIKVEDDWNPLLRIVVMV